MHDALECATKGAENQWMQVPLDQLSVQLGSYPGGKRRARPRLYRTSGPSFYVFG
jgi:hypothetical protein